MSDPLSPLMNNIDPAVAYQEAYDALADAYWEASNMDAKDLIYGAQQAMRDIIHAIDKQALAVNTDLFLQLAPKIKAVNIALEKIKSDITAITKNIATAGKVLAAINKVVSLFPL